MDKPPRASLLASTHRSATLGSGSVVKSRAIFLWTLEGPSYLAPKLLRQLLSLKAPKTKLKNNVRAGSQIVAAPADNPVLGQGR